MTTLITKTKIFVGKRIILKVSVFSKKLSAYHFSREDVWLFLRKLEELGLIRLIPFGKVEILDPALLDWLFQKRRLKEKHDR